VPTPDQFGEHRSYLYTTMSIAEKWGMLTAFLCVPVPSDQIGSLTITIADLAQEAAENEPK
jgi:hypothetical protein